MTLDATAYVLEYRYVSRPQSIPAVAARIDPLVSLRLIVASRLRYQRGSTRRFRDTTGGAR